MLELILDLVVLDSDLMNFLLARLVLDAELLISVELLVVSVLVLLDVLFVLMNVDLEFVDFLLSSVLEIVSVVLELIVLLFDVFELVVKVVESFSELMVLVFNMVKLLSEFMARFLEFLALLLFLFLVLLVVVLDLLVVILKPVVLFFPVSTFLSGASAELDVVSSLFGVMRHSDLHLVDVHSHLVFLLNGVFPFFDHAVFTLEINVSLMLKESNSLFKLVDSVLVKAVHTLHVLEGSVHYHGVRALIREVKTNGGRVAISFEDHFLRFLHLSVSLGVRFLSGMHESVHVLIDSFLTETELFFKFKVELILMVGLLIQLFDSSNQNKVGFLLSVEQVHEVSNFDGNLVSTDCNFSFLGLRLLLGQLSLESFDSLFHHIEFVLVGLLLLFFASTLLFLSILGDGDINAV